MSGTTTPAPTPGVVQFDYSAWSTLYPTLAATVPQTQAQAFFGQAGAYCNNTPCSPVKDLGLRSVILNMLTAHIATLAAKAASGGLVGRISSASEGSVSVSADYQTASPNAAWFGQTSYGADAWQLMAPFRMFRFIPPPPMPFIPTGNGTFPGRRW